MDAIRKGTQNIILYKKVDKKYTGCNLKTTKLLHCVLIGVCAVISLNTVTLVFLFENITIVMPLVHYKMLLSTG